MSRDNKKKTYFDENFFNDDLDSKDNTADFLKSDLPSQRSTEKGGSDKHVIKGKGTNYIQNYKSSVKNTGYSDLLKKKMQPQTNFLTNNNQNIKISHSPDINNHSGMHTINYEGNYVPEASLRELSETSHSPGKHKLVDALHNIDKNMFVKISKKENKQKIENFQVRRASNIREKQKNSLTSLNNILNSTNNKGSKQNIAIVSKVQPPKEVQKENENTEEPNNPSEKSSKLNTANNSKSKLFQRNQKASQATNKFNENVSENNNDTADEIQLKNSRNISQQTNIIVSSESKKDNLNPPHTKKVHYQNLSHNTSFHNDLPELKETAGNVYKRPTRNHKREASQDVSESKHNRMNRTAEVSVEKANDNIFGRSAKQLEERVVADDRVAIPNSKELTEFHIKDHNAESQKHLENVNSVASLTKISKQASPVLEHKLEISTITDHPRTNFPFIYDESIKDHASEEKEINVDRLLLINKRFLEIAQSHSDEKLTLKSNITIGMACKVSHDVFSEIKLEADKEYFELMSKNRELEEKSSEILRENELLKEKLTKSSSHYANDKTVAELSSTIRDLQKYILKLEKENVVLKNEFTNNIKAKNGLLKKFNDDLVDYQRLTTNFMKNFIELEEEEE